MDLAECVCVCVWVLGCVGEQSSVGNCLGTGVGLGAHVPSGQTSGNNSSAWRYLKNQDLPFIQAQIHHGISNNN